MISISPALRPSVLTARISSEHDDPGRQIAARHPSHRAPDRQLKLSERAPTVTPVPSTPKALRAMSARIATSPWLVTLPTRVMA